MKRKAEVSAARPAKAAKAVFVGADKICDTVGITEEELTALVEMKALKRGLHGFDLRTTIRAYCDFLRGTSGNKRGIAQINKELLEARLEKLRLGNEELRLAGETLGVKRLAEVLGVGTQLVREWAGAGCPCTKGEGREFHFILREVFKWRIDRERTSAAAAAIVAKADRVLMVSGLRNVVIARAIGINPNTVVNWRRKPGFNESATPGELVAWIMGNATARVTVLPDAERRLAHEMDVAKVADPSIVGFAAPGAGVGLGVAGLGAEGMILAGGGTTADAGSIATLGGIIRGDSSGLPIGEEHTLARLAQAEADLSADYVAARDPNRVPVATQAQMRFAREEHQHAARSYRDYLRIVNEEKRVSGEMLTKQVAEDFCFQIGMAIARSAWLMTKSIAIEAAKETDPRKIAQELWQIVPASLLQFLDYAVVASKLPGWCIEALKAGLGIESDAKRAARMALEG